MKKILLGGLGAIALGLAGVIMYSVTQGNGVVDTSISQAASTPNNPPNVAEVAPKAQEGEKVSDKTSRPKRVEVQGVPVAEAVPVAQVNYAPDFSLPYLDGSGTFTLADYRGEKPVVVDFFAEHCPFCRKNLPILEKFAAQYDNEVEVILIGIDSEADTRRFLNNRPTTLSLVMSNNKIIDDYKIRYTNTKALIKKDGSLLRMVIGRSITEQDFLDLIEE